MRSFQTIQLTPGAQQLFRTQHEELCRTTDRLFAGLMVLQWIAGIAAAVLFSPRTWIATTYQVHLHVWAALLLGTAISSLPIYLALRFPGRPITRHVIAVAQVCWSALLIHVTGGRIETHFHVFVSLAFLSFYREWRLLILPTLIVALDHAVRGMWWPQSVYGVFVESPFRWLEHAAWVVFEVAVLAGSCQRGMREMQLIAERQDALETTNRHIEDRVEERTRELAASESKLAASESRLRTLLDSSMDPLLTMDINGMVLSVSRSVEQVFGWTPEELVGKDANLLLAGDTPFSFHDSATSTLLGRPREVPARHRDGVEFPSLVTVWKVELPQEQLPLFMGTIRDITEQKNAESELASLNQQLIDSAHKAGKAEIANSVLHNVGNVLNSVNVSAEIINEKISELGISHLTKMASIVQEHLDDFGEFVMTDKRGQHLPQFLIDLSAEMAAEEQTILEEVQSLAGNVAHIKTVISTQQAYARSGMAGVVEPVSLADLIRDAVHVNTSSMRRHRVEVNTQFEDIAPVVVDKHKLLQILVNLISNAKYACMESGNEDHRIDLRLTQPDPDHVRIEVEDNGMGIAEENLTRIFAHGFTTRKEGHGFGLHSAALAAKEMLGSLKVRSPGPGQGATFILEIPYATAGAVACKA